MKDIVKNLKSSNKFLLPYELDSYLIHFTGQLIEQGYTSLTIQGYSDAISHLGTWLHHEGIQLKELNTNIINEFECHHCHCPGGRKKQSISKKYAHRVQRFIHFLYQQGVIGQIYETSDSSPPLAILKFSQYLISCGLSSQTVKRYSHCVNRMLPLLGNRPEYYNVKIIRQTVYELSKHYSTGGLKSLTTSLRSYLRYLAFEEKCSPTLQQAIPTIAQWTLSSLPKYITAPEIEQVIAACDPRTHKGLRDQAIVLLLSRLGLRAHDIVKMQLMHIDWHEGILHLFGKSRREACLPIPQDVGDAILNYIEIARPPVAVERAEVFLCMNAPYRPFASSAAVSGLVAQAIKCSGISTPPSCGAHLLRHSAATHLLRSGASLDTVSTILRHRSLNMTGYYAKVDIPLLETIVQPWPGE